MTSTLGRESLQDSFDDLGTHLSEVTFCVVDLETTGGAETDSITEFGAVKVRGGEVLGEFQTLVNPKSRHPAADRGADRHHQHDGRRRAAAAPGAAGLPRLRREHGAGGPQRTVRHRLPAPRVRGPGLPVSRWPVVDTAALARPILLRDEVANCRLATLARHFRSGTTPQPPGPDRRRGHRRRAARADRAGRQSRRAHHRGPAGVRPQGLAATPRQAHLGNDLPEQPGRLPVRRRARRPATGALRGQVDQHPTPGAQLLHRRREAAPDGGDGPGGDGGRGRSPAPPRCRPRWSSCG